MANRWPLLFSLFLIFQTPLTAGVKLSEVILKEGQPIFIKAGSEREMVLEVKRMPAGRLKIPFEVFDNSCNDNLGAKGIFNAAYLIVKLEAHWTKHPNPQLIGKAVEARTKDQNGQVFAFPVASDFFISSLNSGRKPKLSAGLPHDQWTSENWSWLPGGKNTIPESLYISRWDVEMMLPNPETGVAENRTLGTYSGIKVRKTPEGILENVSNVQAGMDPLYNFIQIPIGDYWALVFPVNRTEFCEVALKPKFQFNQKDDPTVLWVPYILGSDEAIDLNEQTFLNFIFKFPANYEVD